MAIFRAMLKYSKNNPGILVWMLPKRTYGARGWKTCYAAWRHHYLLRRIWWLQRAQSRFSRGVLMWRCGLCNMHNDDRPRVTIVDWMARRCD